MGNAIPGILLVIYTPWTIGSRSTGNRYAIPQPIDRLIGVPIGVVQGARDVWRYLLQDRGRRSSSVLGA